jgi:hypothetical protein
LPLGNQKKEPVPGGTPGCPDTLSFLTAPGYPGSTMGALREEVIFLMYSFAIEFLDSMTTLTDITNQYYSSKNRTYAEPIQFIQYQTHQLEILGNLNITV